MFGCLKRAACGFLVAGFLASSSASALTQPNNPGLTIPALDTSVTTCTDKNVEVCIDGAEGDPGAIDTQADALIAPETFQPTCQLTFRPIVKGGSIYDVFGWYNVKEDPNKPGKFLKPTQSELYGMFVANDFKTGAQLAGQSVVLDLGVEAAAGRYKGGQIGFFLVSTSDVLSIDPTTHKVIGTIRFQFHTQHELNTTAGTFYQVLTWESVTKKNLFYFGWEDLPGDQGSDNDFDDFVFSVEGVQCGGGGQPCDTGGMGVCSAGVMQCKKGVIQCIQTLQPVDEVCNALDDDCDGEVDQGDLCEANEVCHLGVCVPNCGTGEFRCPSGSDCDAATGLCIDEACQDVPCPAGQVCQVGECVDSCTGITCPYDRVCRNGGCIDPCIGIECDEGFSCVKGICSNCACSACGDGQVCSDTSVCIDTGCENQTCADGTHCAGGNCVDDCDGVVCPDGQLCSAGECVADPSGTGNDGTGGTDVVIITPNSGNGSGANGTGGNGSTPGGRHVKDEPGCACSLPGSAPGGSASLLLLALLGLSRRRRPRA
jgi:hypothetical protein